MFILCSKVHVHFTLGCFLFAVSKHQTIALPGTQTETCQDMSEDVSHTCISGQPYNFRLSEAYDVKNIITSTIFCCCLIASQADACDRIFTQSQAKPQLGTNLFVPRKILVQKK